MKKITGKISIVNGKLYPISKAVEKISFANSAIYEVIRVINGVPLFFEDHMARLEHSLTSKQTGSVHDISNISYYMQILIEANAIRQGNVRIDLIIKDKIITDVLVYQISANYPTSRDYRQGVKLTYFHAERKKPEIKQTNLSLRSQINVLLEQTRAFEALLINENDEITEGSRSNVFFIQSDVIYTAPNTMVLEGITAKYVRQICNNMNIPVSQQPVKLSELSLFESCFITGTSPKILPVFGIEEVRFEVNHKIINQLMEAYNKMIYDYVDRKNLQN